MEGWAISLVCFLHACHYELYVLPPSSCLSHLLHTNLWVYRMARTYVINMESNIDCPSVIKADDGFQGLQ
jgi:hypothetical protein